MLYETCGKKEILIQALDVEDIIFFIAATDKWQTADQGLAMPV